MTTQTKRDILLTNTFDEITKAWQGNKRRIFLEGGTWSSKTYSAMQFLVFLLENDKGPEPLLATVTSESMPHLKAGAMLDFLNIMGDELIESQWNRSDHIYTFPKSGCKLEFKSDDHPEKWAGPRRDIWFLNELPNIHRMSYMEGDMRTRLFTIADWNPYGEFWFHDDKLAEEKQCQNCEAVSAGKQVCPNCEADLSKVESKNVYIHGLTYHDTPEVVSKQTIATIEGYKDKDPNYYRVHALGLLGNLEGLVYPLFKQVDSLPEGDYFYGLDFAGATEIADPTVLTKHVIIGEHLYSQEMFYVKGMTNDQIARAMIECGVKSTEPVYPDPNESDRTLIELGKYGFWFGETLKGKGSVDFGVRRVNEYYQHWTKDSLNCIKEQRNYRYLEDKQHPGRYTDKTTHQWSHGMRTREYAVRSFQPQQHGAMSRPVDYLGSQEPKFRVLTHLG